MLWWSGLMEKYKISIKWQGAIPHSVTLELQSFSSTENLAFFHTINRRTFFLNLGSSKKGSFLCQAHSTTIGERSFEARYVRIRTELCVLIDLIQFLLPFLFNLFFALRFV